MLHLLCIMLLQLCIMLPLWCITLPLLCIMLLQWCTTLPTMPWPTQQSTMRQLTMAFASWLTLFPMLLATLLPTMQWPIQLLTMLLPTTPPTIWLTLSSTLLQSSTVPPTASLPTLSPRPPPSGSPCRPRCSSHPPFLLPHPCRPCRQAHDEGGKSHDEGGQVLGGGDAYADGRHVRDEGDGGDGQHGRGELVSPAGPGPPTKGRSHIYLFQYL